MLSPALTALRSAWLIVCLSMLCGCWQRERADLKDLASVLVQSWPDPAGPVRMTLSIRESGGHAVVHCRLQNISSKSVFLNRSEMPWKGALFFTGNVVTADGRTFPVGPPSIIAYIFNLPDPFSMAASEVMEDDFELNGLPGSPLVGSPMPKDEDAIGFVLALSGCVSIQACSPRQNFKEWNRHTA